MKLLKLYDEMIFVFAFAFDFVTTLFEFIVVECE